MCSRHTAAALRMSCSIGYHRAHSAHQAALERQDLSCTYLAHHELESIIIITIIIINSIIIIVVTLLIMVQLIRRHMPRYEGQMQSQRLRMVSDSELRLEQFQAERKDEKRRYEDALDRLKQVCSSRASCSTHTHRCRSTPAIKFKFFQGRAVLPSFPEVQSRRV